MASPVYGAGSICLPHTQGCYQPQSIIPIALGSIEIIKVCIAQKRGGRIMVHESTSICDVDEGFITKDRSGMVVIGLTTGMMRTFLKMSQTRFEKFYQDLSEFRNMEFKPEPIAENAGT